MKYSLLSVSNIFAIVIVQLKSLTFARKSGFCDEKGWMLHSLQIPKWLQRNNSASACRGRVYLFV